MSLRRLTSKQRPNGKTRATPVSRRFPLWPAALAVPFAAAAVFAPLPLDPPSGEEVVELAAGTPAPTTNLHTRPGASRPVSGGDELEPAETRLAPFRPVDEDWPSLAERINQLVDMPEPTPKPEPEPVEVVVDDPKETEDKPVVDPPPDPPTRIASYRYVGLISTPTGRSRAVLTFASRQRVYAEEARLKPSPPDFRTHGTIIAITPLQVLISGDDDKIYYIERASIGPEQREQLSEAWAELLARPKPRAPAPKRDRPDPEGDADRQAGEAEIEDDMEDPDADQELVQEEREKLRLRRSGGASPAGGGL